LRVGSSFLLDPTLNTSPNASTPKSVAMEVFMSHLGLKTWDPCEVVNPTTMLSMVEMKRLKFHAINLKGNWHGL
jgi:hypothetical protein